MPVVSLSMLFARKVHIELFTYRRPGGEGGGGSAQLCCPALAGWIALSWRKEVFAPSPFPPFPLCMQLSSSKC